MTSDPPAETPAGDDNHVVPPPATRIPTGTVLIRGCHGPLVVALQTALKADGHFVGHKITGHYDDATRDAVAVFQAQRGLFVDGVANDGVWQALGLYSQEKQP